MKLIFENWRKFLTEVETKTVPAKKGVKQRAANASLDQRFSLPEDLMPTLFNVFVGDPTTFSLIHDKYDIHKLKAKGYQEVKYDPEKKYKELIQQMLYEPIKTLQAIGHYGNIKKKHYKDFFDFVLKLPEKERIHVLTALAIYSDKWTEADIIGLLAFAREQIALYGCLFHERNPASFKVSSSDYHHCRGECMAKCEAEKKECLDRGREPASCAQKEEECKKACEEKITSEDLLPQTRARRARR